MALTERDINTQRDLPRNKRHSVQQDLAYTRLKDENSPSPGLRGKNTKTAPLSQRLLAPTKSSAAKTTTTSPRVAGPSTPQPRASSKLPRRTTPNTAPSMAGNDSSIASPEVLEAGLEFTTTDPPADSRSTHSQAVSDCVRAAGLQSSPLTLVGCAARTERAQADSGSAAQREAFAVTPMRVSCPHSEPEEGQPDSHGREREASPAVSRRQAVRVDSDAAALSKRRRSRSLRCEHG